MDFLRQAELLSEIAQEIIYVAIPKDWQRIAYYTERLHDPELGLRNKSTSDCWVGTQMVPYNNAKGPPLKGSVELFEAINTLFEEAWQSNQLFYGINITVDNSGKYKSKFYYEGTPLLDANDDECDKRLYALT